MQLVILMQLLMLIQVVTDVAFDVDAAGEVVIPDDIAGAGGDQVAADIVMAILQLFLLLSLCSFHKYCLAAIPQWYGSQGQAEEDEALASPILGNNNTWLEVKEG